MKPMAQISNASAVLLKKVAIFSGLDEPEFAFLTSHVVQRKFAAGELIFGEAEPCNGLYVIESGTRANFQELSRRARAGAVDRWSG